MRILTFAVVSLAAGVACGAEVYRSVDANGVVKFSDRPEEAAERIVVVTAGAAAAVRGRASTGRAEAPRTEPVVVDGGEVERQPTAAERAEERARNCQIATQRAERYRTSRRLYRELPNGEREYLDDAELASARADAESDVSSWCD